MNLKFIFNYRREKKNKPVVNDSRIYYWVYRYEPTGLVLFIN